MTLPGLRYAEVLGRRMAYREAGRGSPVVLLHGNPTSSYLWRHLFSAIGDGHRVIAPDLLGMGGSEKLPSTDAEAYRFAGQAAHLEVLLDVLGASDRVVLVGHDWGAALAFDWAARHPLDVRGVAYAEAIVRPRKWSEESEGGRQLFRQLRSAAGERLVLDENVFVEAVLPAGTLSGLATEDHDAYRAPYREPGDGRRAMLTWAREIPFDGEPADVERIVESYSAWLRTSGTPKLFIRADPGAILTGEVVEYCRAFPAQDEVCVTASHFVPEDAPEELAEAVRSWLGRLPH